MRLTREELRTLRDIERHLAAEDPGLTRRFGKGPPRRRYLRWARVLGVAWLPAMLIGDATRQGALGIAGVVLLLAALTLAMVAYTH